MKLSKNCKTTKGCYTSGNGNNDRYEFILADGASVSVQGGNPNYLVIYVDIDGLNKGKNSSGIDTFGFEIISPNFNLNPSGTNYGSADFPYGASSMPDGCQPKGLGCTRWVIDYDNMDYLKLDSSGKCPNGSALNVEASPPVVSCK